MLWKTFWSLYAISVTHKQNMGAVVKATIFCQNSYYKHIFPGGTHCIYNRY